VKGELISYIPKRALESYNLDLKKLLPHLVYTFAIEKISRACSHQLVRHRVASFSQQSQRFITVKHLKEKVVIPPTIKSEENFKELIEKASKTYRRFVDQGVPKEDARYVLPNATETSLLMTIDGKSLFHFFGLRCCSRAQWEIKNLADELLTKARRGEPEVFNNAGPYCYQLGYCPEGRFSCGKMQEAIESYSVKDT
jgi:thymidylate synthase (FAD)